MAGLVYEIKTIEINARMMKCYSHSYAHIKYSDGSVVCPLHYFRTKPYKRLYF